MTEQETKILNETSDLFKTELMPLLEEHYPEIAEKFNHFIAKLHELLNSAGAAVMIQALEANKAKHWLALVSMAVSLFEFEVMPYVTNKLSK
jgi:hypothetical protein